MPGRRGGPDRHRHRRVDNKVRMAWGSANRMAAWRQDRYNSGVSQDFPETSQDSELVLESETAELSAFACKLRQDFALPLRVVAITSGDRSQQPGVALVSDPD